LLAKCKNEAMLGLARCGCGQVLLRDVCRCAGGTSTYCGWFIRGWSFPALPVHRVRVSHGTGPQAGKTFCAQWGVRRPASTPPPPSRSWFSSAPSARHHTTTRVPVPEVGGRGGARASCLARPPRSAGDPRGSARTVLLYGLAGVPLPLLGFARPRRRWKGRGRFAVVPCARSLVGGGPAAPASTR
jgi:hypothetical protein